EEVITQEDIVNLRSSYKAHLDSELAKSDSVMPVLKALSGKWEGMVVPNSVDAIRDPETGFLLETLKDVGRASTEVPDGFAMAFGSLMLEGYDVRISGQDVGRGTFSQRHAMLVDQLDEGVTVPLNARLNSKGRLELANSSLSEMAVLGFEYGMSWESPKLLSIWEAQFGDFFNGAQVIFDTFISSAESKRHSSFFIFTAWKVIHKSHAAKWLAQSGIVILLPHGLDGAGPEHSSMRIERMLQLTNDALIYGDGARDINMHVVYPTNPAQYFHLLRRQMKRNYRRPLIVAAPKGLLRLPAAASSITDFEPTTRFQPVLDEQMNNTSSVERVVLLTGKIYYDLLKERAERGLENKVALIRIEELSPFPFRMLQDVLGRYSQACDVYWLQEEPRNQGAWTHVEPRINNVLERIEGDGRNGSRALRYIGRKEDALPAVGVGKVYKEQQNTVLRAAFGGLK
ncbi:hypothetical protein EW145_g2992, partial [Phellinidium pouzarii]